MSSKERMQEDVKFDLRTLEMKMRRGDVTREEYEAFLKKIPNDESKAEYIEVFEEKTGDELTPHVERLTFT